MIIEHVKTFSKYFQNYLILPSSSFPVAYFEPNVLFTLNLTFYSNQDALKRSYQTFLKKQNLKEKK